MVLKHQTMLQGSHSIRDEQNNKVDRISELPVSLIHDILSFLPTKYVVRTSILSKKWKWLWTSMPVLDIPEWWWSFDGEYNENDKAKSFEKFMDRLVLSPHNDIPKVRRFCLKFDTNLFDESRVNDWISTLVRHKVEELKLIIIDTSHLFVFPPCLFTSETLTKLDLDQSLNHEHDLILPDSIYFPRLKILRLHNITLWNEKFVSNCPMLEELSLNRCFWFGKIGNLADQPTGFFYFHVLKELRFSDCTLDIRDDLSISAPALQSLYFAHVTDTINDCVITIYAPSLLSLVYQELVARDYILSSFLSLVDADIDIILPNEEIHAASKLFRALSGVKRLKMSADTVWTLYLIDADLIYNLPTFYNLVHLEVTEDSCRLFSSKMLDVFHILPNLESLVFITQGFPSFKTRVNVSWKQGVVPQCLLLHLRSIEFRGFCGNQKDVNVVKLFLTNARVLQRMTIFFENLEDVEIEEIIHQILLFPKGSTSCEVDFLTSC